MHNWRPIFQLLSLWILPVSCCVIGMFEQLHICLYGKGPIDSFTIIRLQAFLVATLYFLRNWVILVDFCVIGLSEQLHVCLFWKGPIDSLYNHQFGQASCYKTLFFEKLSHPCWFLCFPACDIEFFWESTSHTLWHLAIIVPELATRDVLQQTIDLSSITVLDYLSLSPSPTP